MNRLLFLILVLIGAKIHARTNLEVHPDFQLFEISTTKNAKAFTWDEYGNLWTSRSLRRGIVITKQNSPNENLLYKPRRGKGSNFLIHDSTIMVADGETIRRFKATNKRFLEIDPLKPPAKLFRANTQFSSLLRGPLGHLYFAFDQEGGIGRYNPRKEEWDITNKGLEGGNFTFDPFGQMIASDASSRMLFRPKAGLDYKDGLINYSKSDVALSTDIAPGKLAAVAIYSGDQWPVENQFTWLVHDRQDNTLKQYSEKNDSLHYWRDLVKLPASKSISHLQIGPEGTLWFISGESVVKLAAKAAIRSGAQDSLPALTTKQLAGILGHSNSWHRQTSLALLEQRPDLVNVRGLHPATPFSEIFNKTNSPLTRVHALWALHRLNLLEEVPVEEGAKDPSEMYRLWCAILFGERGYPTGMTFQRLHRLAGDSNSVVRAAVAVSVRQFNSSRFLVDMEPLIMPIREVFTGGILSGLWFSIGKGRDPEFDLLFWNALKPISGFDPVHLLGFFEYEKENTNQFAFWLVTQICNQMGETESALKQQDGLAQLRKWAPENHKLLAAGLEGFRNGFQKRKVEPTEESLEILRQFALSPHSHINQPVQSVLSLAKMKRPAITSKN